MPSDQPSLPPLPAGFPLYRHKSGKFAKKVKGKTLYFGQWSDPASALLEYENRVLGSTPEKPRAPKLLTVWEACQLFLASKEAHVEQRKLASRTFTEYLRTCKRISAFFGKDIPIESLKPAAFSDFMNSRAKTCNPISVGNEITRVKTMLNWLERSKYTGKIEVGPDFRKPEERIVRRHRRERGKLMFTAEEVRAILDESGIQLRAMVLMAINCGFQNSDLEQISYEKITEAMDTGWVEFPRVKTEVDRRCPLWTSTEKAIHLAMKRRVDTELPNAFLRRNGRPYSGTNGDIAKRFRAARDHAMIDRGGFSWMRKTFATAAAGAKDKEARDYIMGHADKSMSALYVQEVWDERLIAVTKSVRSWLRG